MPGLLRGMARVAVISGTATAVSNNVSRRQARRYGEEDQQAVQQDQSAPQGGDDPMSDLQQLGQLHESGVLTDEEFAAKKAEILQRM